MRKIALLGAGGKMGVRLASNLADSAYEVYHTEITPEGRERLKNAVGSECVEQDEAIAEADAVILAVPDRLIGRVSREIVDSLNPGTALVVLDAAAPHAGEMPDRDDITIFVTHPCHPALYAPTSGNTDRPDLFGGEEAVQHIVCALMRGPEEHYAACERIARTIYAPVDRSHRCTVENIAILEPAMSETVAATFCYALREAVDAAVRRGVPEQAARDFMLGHLGLELAIVFKIYPGGQFSDGAMRAIELAKPEIFRDGWIDRVFEPEAVLASVKDICASQ
ncbi:MAG: NAD(P)-binding domain-containing protein [Albidovulum sp.]|nr:NAD(P)-binding domain-containing protein [Albidovulum sp.]